MAKSAAQRQAEYRKRRPTASENGERRINLWVTTRTALALQRLAKRYGVTQRQMLEQLVQAEDQNIQSTLDLDTPAWDAYFEKRDVTQ